MTIYRATWRLSGTPADYDAQAHLDAAVVAAENAAIVTNPEARTTVDGSETITLDLESGSPAAILTAMRFVVETFDGLGVDRITATSHEVTV